MVEEHSQKSDQHEELMRKLADMERDLAALRVRNEELELERAQYLTLNHTHLLSHNNNNHVDTNNTNAPALHSEPGTTAVSPLVLSPSSVPPSEETILQKQIQTMTKTEDDLIAQLHQKDEKIEFLEQNVALYKKKLRQTEELLYELQWDPSQDLEVFNIDSKKEVQSRHEQKIAQLLEQMRIMEKGLREKQQTIDELRGIAYEEEAEQAQADSSLKNSSMSPSLKSVVVASDGIPRMNLSSSGGLRNSQNLRRRNSTTQHHHPSPSTTSWLSYIPFFGERTPPGKTATL